MYRLKPHLFNLNYTLDCGQVFRWEREGNWWTGVVGDHVIRLSQENGQLIIDSTLTPEFFSHYFRFDDDLPSIYESINRDLLIDRAIRKRVKRGDRGRHRRVQRLARAGQSG